MSRHPSLAALGRNLRASRRKRGLTQEKLAELGELDPTYISGIERGIRNPSLLSLLRIAKALGLPVADLCKGLTHEPEPGHRRRAARADRAVPSRAWRAVRGD